MENGILRDFIGRIGLIFICILLIMQNGCDRLQIVEVKKSSAENKTVPKSSVKNVHHKPVSSKSASKPADSIESSVLTVNSANITADDIINRIRPQLIAAAQTYSRDAYYVKAKQLAMQAVYDVIYETLLYQEISSRISKEQNPAIEKAVDQAIERMVVNQAGGSKIRFERQLAQQGMDIRALRKKLRKQILTQQYLREKFRSRVIVTRDQLWEYYKTHSKEFYSPACVHIFMIEVDTDKFLPDKVRWDSASSQQRQLAQALAEKRIKFIQKKLSDGQEFSQVAKEFSTSPSGKVGGDIGWITKGSYKYKPIEDAAFSLRPGSISKPIHIGRKTYIIKVAGLVEAKTTSFSAAQDKIRSKLEQKMYADLVNEHIHELWKRSEISPIQPFLQTVLKCIPSYYSMKKKAMHNAQ